MLKIVIISVIINMTARTCWWWGFCGPCFVDIGIGLGGGFSIKLLGIAHFEGRGGDGYAQIVLHLFLWKWCHIICILKEKEGLGRQSLKIRQSIDNPILALKNWLKKVLPHNSWEASGAKEKAWNFDQDEMKGVKKLDKYIKRKIRYNIVFCNSNNF